MKRKIYCLGLFLIWSLIIPLKTQALKVGDLPVGAVIKLGEYKFIKITSQGLFVTLNPYPELTFQDFTSNQCNSLATCNIGDDCETNGSTVTLTDSRDNKTYRIRKFADGNCWMIDNLAYGGSSTDGCSGKSTFDGGRSSNTTGYSVYGTWTGAVGTSSESFYGSCMDPKGVTCSNPSEGCDSTYCSTHDCGYYYSWQAAVQNSLAYYGNTYQPTEPVTGICPSGWQIPTGTGNNSFLALHSAMGYTTSGPKTATDGRQYWDCVTGCTGFWQATPWAGLFSGYVYYNGARYDQGLVGDWWSSSQDSSVFSYILNFTSEWVKPLYSANKFSGFSVRCLFSP